MKFIATKELGRLCKWLRIMGYDTSYFPEAERRELVIKSLREDRIILTRDSGMSVYSGIRLFHVKSDFVEEQVKQAVEGLGIKVEQDRLFTVCVICNAPLKKVAKKSVEGKVPHYVYETQNSFMQCGICGRIYWQGTHWNMVREFVDRMGL